MRLHRGIDGPPCGFESPEQRAEQSPDVVRVLPLILARHAQAYWRAATSAYAATGRVGLLRGYGNAIVPQVAAEFVTAFLEAQPSS